MTSEDIKNKIWALENIVKYQNKEIERLKKIIHELWNEQYPNPHLVQYKYEQFKTENNL